MLRRISINNYKMFRDFELDFTEGVNLICGTNGSGKSALREVLFALTNFLAIPDVSDHVAHSVQEAFPPDVFCRWGAEDEQGAISIGFVLGSEDDFFAYSLTIMYDFRRKRSCVQKEVLEHFVKSETLSPVLDFSSGKLAIFSSDGKALSIHGDPSMSALGTGSQNSKPIYEFCTQVARLFPVYLDPSAIAADFSTGSQRLGVRGENFSAWHAYSTALQPEKQELFRSQCKNFIPGFIADSSPASGDIFRWKVRVKYKGNYFDLALRELSDGQKKLFALYSLLAYVPDGSTLIIDEPENYLSPRELQPWLDAMHDAWEDRNIQFILITHNPKTLNWYHKEAIIFKIVGNPPGIVAEKNSTDTPDTLFDKLSEMEWTGDGTES
ncbi:MAG: AAA family ATPase [Clostridia bacterium]|nr:AAA family ATPase [Clostridia bacterium]